jgi:hypothetical protein
MVTWSSIPEAWISSKTRRTNRSRGWVWSGAPASTFVSMLSLDEVQDVLELHHAKAVDHLLLAEAGQLPIAAVHGLDLGQRQILDVLPDVRVHRVTLEERTGVTTFLGADLPVVIDHDLLILRDVRVQFQSGHTEPHRLGETLQRFLRGQAETAAVSLQVEVGLLRKHIWAVRL